MLQAVILGFVPRGLNWQRQKNDLTMLVPLDLPTQFEWHHGHWLLPNKYPVHCLLSCARDPKNQARRL